MVKKETQEEKELREQINGIYTPLSVAKKEAVKRWKDKELKKKVENFLKKKLPSFLNDGPKACLGRNIASPNFELKYFLNLAKEINLEPVFIEHTGDKFVSNNSDKYHLAKMYFYDGDGRNGGSRVTSMNIIDFNECQGKPFNKIKATWGEDIVDFHHRILELAFPGSTKRVHDISCMLDKGEYKLSDFYHRYLAVFLCGGILFENYPSSKKDAEFTLDVVIPCCKMLEKEFGIKPLIVPLEPIEDEISLYWWSYPKSLEKFAADDNKIKTKKADSVNPKLAIKNTDKYGKGVFAGEDIKKGRAIRFFDGEIISRKECIERVAKGKLGNDDSLPIGGGSYVVLDPISFTFNHSCNPNSGFRKRSELFALRDIKKGEEIAYDYSSTVGSDTPPELWTMKCECGSKNCRKKLSYVLSIPQKQLEKYQKLGALQDHIITELKNLKKVAK
jgi:uncharacterized protein